MALKNRIGEVVLNDEFFCGPIDVTYIAKRLHAKKTTVRGRVSEMVRDGQLMRDETYGLQSTATTPCTCPDSL